MHSNGCLMLLGFCRWPWLTKGCNPLLSQYIKRACPFVGRWLPVQTKLMAKLILALKGMLLLRNHYLLSSFFLCRKCCFNQLYYLVNFKCCHSVRTKSLHRDMSNQCLMALPTKSYLSSHTFLYQLPPQLSCLLSSLSRHTYLPALLPVFSLHEQEVHGILIRPDTALQSNVCKQLDCSS